MTIWLWDSFYAWRWCGCWAISWSFFGCDICLESCVYLRLTSYSIHILMARTPTVRQKKAPPTSSSKAKTRKGSISKRKPSPSNGKKAIVSSAKAKEKVQILYYDIDFHGDKQFKEKYEVLFRRGVLATKYCDEDALEILCIEDDVRWLFDNIGLGNFLMTKTPTSKRATLEFLSSLKVHVFPLASSGESSITFQLFNNIHTWTLEQLNAAFGLPSGGPRVTPQRWSVEKLWRVISVESNYDSSLSSLLSTRHPALRYTLKVLSNTIFGRQEGSKVRQDDLFMLEHMLHASPIDTGAFLINQMQRVANNVKTGGKIVQGGFITRIATYLGYSEHLMRDGFVDGTDAVEVPFGWFKKKDGTILWCIRDDEDELPPPEHMTLRHKKNWSFTHSPTRDTVSLPVVRDQPSSLPPCEGTRSAPSPPPPTLESLQISIDEIKANQKVIIADQKDIKDQLASVSTILTGLDAWLRSQGFAHLSLPPP